MTFSKEDNAAWGNSEIMQEFEKIALEADVLNGPPEEAFKPIETEEKVEETWEDENDEEKLLSAIEELGISEEEGEEDEEGDLKEELMDLYTADLLTNLQKLAHELAANSKMNAAYTVERTIMEIKNLQGGK